jgi:type IV secretory pathway TrbD component
MREKRGKLFKGTKRRVSVELSTGITVLFNTTPRSLGLRRVPRILSNNGVLTGILIMHVYTWLTGLSIW